MKLPRLIVAGLAGDSGKTIVSCGLLKAMSEMGMNCGPFKKGPDYIDPEWLQIASGNTCRNLDTWMMGKEKTLSSFTNNAIRFDINLIEGNRGLFDGFDKHGTHSTAELAKLLKAPVILSITVKKVTRTVSAYVLGCKMLDPDLNIAGVILNQVSNKRQKELLKCAIEDDTGVPVLGTIPRFGNTDILPSRHLGLVTPGEFDLSNDTMAQVGKLIADNCDMERIIEIAGKAPDINGNESAPEIKNERTNVKIGYFYDRAYSFYYKENLEALEKQGAEMMKISSLDEKKLPDIDGLYIGGGFPETNIEKLSKNHGMLDSVKFAAGKGMPIYGECGGLMYLCRSIEIDGSVYPLADIFNAELKMSRKPEGHGYMEIISDKENGWFEKNKIVKGHEFHYSYIADRGDIETCMEVKRGKGTFDKRDGMIYKNTFAAYLHLHAIATPAWAETFVRLAVKYKNQKDNVS